MVSGRTVRSQITKGTKFKPVMTLFEGEKKLTAKERIVFFIIKSINANAQF